MAVGLVEQLRSLRAALAAFDPALNSGEQCAELVHELARTLKACAAAQARAAARAAECGAHRHRGPRHADDWLARTSGTSRRSAAEALEAARGVGRCPATAAAWAAGRLSAAQAGEIIRTEAEVPGSEAEMLALALGCDLATLVERARKLRLEALDPGQLHKRQHQGRYLRHWRDGEGMVRLSGALPPLVGVGIVNRLEAQTDRLRRRARAEASTERREAHAADALVAMLAGARTPKAGRPEVVLVCDLGAYRRGQARPGEPCHIVGGGPVPAEVVRKAVEGDAFVKAVVHDGVRIDSVVHYGRHIPAEVRTALELGSPPEFAGTTCADGCGRRYGLQWDHVNPLANGGSTTAANLAPRCWGCHQDKTERDRRAGLLGGRRPEAATAAHPP